MSPTDTLDDLVFSIPVQYHHKDLESLLSSFSKSGTDKEQLLWSHIEHYQQHHATYLVWQRWLNGPEHLRPSQELLTRPTYWNQLVNGLGSGDRFAQKFSLDLLLRSIQLLDHDVSTKHDASIEHVGIRTLDSAFHFEVASKMDYLRQYKEFCDLFEIIVFNGYINQVKEALAAFPNISILDDPYKRQPHENSLVPMRFWTTLLTSALESKNDSLCDCVGRWLLGSPYTIQAVSTAHILFISTIFLDWMTTARLFTATISRRGKTVSCAHGDGLAAFFSKLVSICQNDEARSFYVHGVLRSLYHRVERCFPTAIYVLQGIAAPLRSVEWLPTENILDVVLKISRLSNLSVTQRLILTAHCRSIWKNCPKAAALLNQEEDLKRLVFEPDKLATADELYPDLAAIRGAFRENISKQSLHMLCSSTMAKLRQRSDLAKDHATWHNVVWALWTESDLKDHPRGVIMVLSRITLHPGILMLAQADKAFQEFLSARVLELFALANGRLYLWNTFSESLLNALLQVDGIFDFLPIAEIFERFVNHPPSPTAEYLIDLALSSTVLDERGEQPYKLFADEGYGHACMFDILARLRVRHRGFARHLLDGLLTPWLNQMERCQPVPMISDWKTTAQLQAIILLLESAIDQTSKSDLEDYRDKLLEIASIEPMPRFRFLLEWGIIALCLRLQPLIGMDAADHILDLLTPDDQSQPKFTVSLVKISTLLCLNAQDEDYCRKLLTRLVVLSASSRITIRHDAQWHFPILWNYATSEGLQSITNNELFSSLYKFIESLEKYHDPPRYRILAAFDPAQDRDLRTLFQGGYLQIDPPEKPLCTSSDFEAIQTRLKIPDLDIVYPSLLPIGRVGQTQNQTAGQEPDSSFSDEEQFDTPNGQSLDSELVASLQTKGYALLSASNRFGCARASGDLTVIASLIENPHNLGGLCRVSEIFGAQELHVPSLATIKNKAFQSVSVSSELHISIIETRPSSLAELLRQKKEQGFSLVGIEQTNGSIVLPAPHRDVEWQKERLPTKCVLILGAERTGIPASILGTVDHCVEIRQWGVTRSLNVQTAAAVVIYEWRRIWEEVDGRLNLEDIVEIDSVDGGRHRLTPLT